MISQSPNIKDRSNFYKLICDISHDGIALHKEGEIFFANKAFYTLFGYEESDQLPSLYDLTSETTRDIFQNKINSASGSFETIGNKKDGSQVLLEFFFQNIIHNNEEINTVVVKDVTKRKNIEKALIRTAQEYKILFEDSKDAIYISSRDGKILDVNKAATDLFGYSKKELLNLDTHKLYVNPKDRIKFQYDVEKYGAVADYEVKLKRKDGKLLDCILSSTLRLSKDNTIIGYQGIIKNITEIKKDHDLKKAKELAERSAKLKEQFLAKMSHEIRTPLNAVIGMTHLLLDDDLYPQQKKYLETIRNSTDHLLMLINDILDFSKIEAGKIEFNHRTFDLNSLLENVCSTNRYKAEAKNLKLIYHPDKNIPRYVIGDPIRLNQILLNLISNAIKFTNYGRIELTVKILEENTHETTLTFTVKDTGIGIARERLNDIFDSFTQINNKSTREFGGTGLGLAITKELIELQGGSISVKSEINRGSAFNFILKFKKAKSQQMPRVTETATNLPQSCPANLKILIAEDNKVNQFVISETLSKWCTNIKIDLVENGKDALQKFRESDYDLVLMDVQMPIMDGHQATRSIRKDFSAPKNKVPILAMTAYATTGEADKCLSMGMNDYISKPFDPSKLFQKISALVGNEEQAPSGKVKASKMGPIVNTAYLNSVSMGDYEMKERMVEMILEEMPIELEKLKLHSERNEWDKLKAVAHKFKSTGTYLGNPALQENILLLENNARNQKNLESIPGIVNQIIKTCTAAKKELKQLFKNRKL